MKQFEKWLPGRTAILHMAILLYTLEQCWISTRILPHNDVLSEGVKAISALLLVLTILRQDFTPRLYLIYGLAALGAATIRLRTGFMADVFTLLMILAIRQDDLTPIIRIIRRTITAFLVVHLCCYLYLLCTGRLTLFAVDPVGRVRADLGMVHPNTAGSFFLSLVMAWAWEKYDSFRPIQLVYILILGTGVYLLTDSRTTYACVIALCALLLSARYSERASKLMNGVAGWITPAIGIFLLVCSLLWDWQGPILKIDSLLSGRIHLSRRGIVEFGFTLFGQKVQYGAIPEGAVWNTWVSAFTFDCAYSYLWSNIGILWLVLICFCFYRLSRLRNPRISLFLILWALYSVTETLSMISVRFFPLLLISVLFLPKDEAHRLYGPKAAASQQMQA